MSDNRVFTVFEKVWDTVVWENFWEKFSTRLGSNLRKYVLGNCWKMLTKNKENCNTILRKFLGKSSIGNVGKIFNLASLRKFCRNIIPTFLK